VDKGITNHYIVRVLGALIDPTAQNSSWTVSLNNVIVDLGGAAVVNASTYLNMGDLPITETK